MLSHWCARTDAMQHADILLVVLLVVLVVAPEYGEGAALARARVCVGGHIRRRRAELRAGAFLVFVEVLFHFAAGKLW